MARDTFRAWRYEAINRRIYKTIWIWIGKVTFYGCIVGLVVYAIAFGPGFDGEALAWSLLHGTLYAAGMMGAQQLSGAILVKRIPLDSRRAVAIHVVVQSLVLVASFIGVTLLIDLIFGLNLFGNRWLMVIPSMVALSASVVLNAAHYLELFYKRLRMAEQATLQAQLQTLRAQINPHFLFNSLNSIAALIRIQPAAAEELTESLADLFRYSLRSSQHPSVTLADELRSVDLYLSIERARFRDRLHVELNVPDHLLNTMVPSLMLQPLVENAVKHGVGASAGVVDITISAYRQDDRIILRVDDTGPGFDDTDSETVFTKGTGLSNVRDRLRHLFGDQANMVIHADGIELRLPGGDR